MYSSEINKDVIDIIRSKNIRVTIPRVSILRVLKNSPIELTAIDIQKKLSDIKIINISSIYKTLKEFEDKGFIQRYKRGDDQSSFSFKRSYDTVRFTCKACRKIFSFDTSTYQNKEDLINLIQNLSDKYEFGMISFSLNIDVRCDDCLDK